jgi:hypothetical protein
MHFVLRICRRLQNKRRIWSSTHLITLSVEPSPERDPCEHYIPTSKNLRFLVQPQRACVGRRAVLHRDCFILASYTAAGTPLAMRLLSVCLGANNMHECTMVTLMPFFPFFF